MGVYVLQMRGTPFFKIGRSKDAAARCFALEQTAPLPIDVIGWWPHAEDTIETDALHAFAKHATRGEWVSLTPDLLEKLLTLIERKALGSWKRLWGRNSRTKPAIFRREPVWQPHTALLPFTARSSEVS